MNNTEQEIKKTEETIEDLQKELDRPEVAGELKGKKILIVDDDNFLLEMYVRKFIKSGFEVESALGGEETLAKIKEGYEPDIFLFDLIMPRMDGLELLENIKKENLIPNTTMIVLSNQGQQTDINKAKEIGVDGYIVKALHTPSEVVEIVIEIYKEKNK